MRHGEVETQEAFAAQPKRRPATGSDSGTLGDPGGKLLHLHAGCREIDPGEVGGLQGHGFQAGNQMDARVKSAAILIEVGVQPIDPGSTLRRIGGSGHVHPETVGRDAHFQHYIGESLVQNRISNDDVADMGARDVEGLGAGGHHHQTVGNARDIGHHVVGLAGHDKVVVNLVRHQDQVVADAEISNALQFGGGPDPATGVVRRAEDEQRLAPGHLRIPSGEVHGLYAIFQAKRAFDHGAARRFDDAGKRVVNRRGEHNAVAGLTESVDAKRGAVDQTMGGEDVFGVHNPAMAGLHPPADRRQIGGIVAEIAVDAMGQQPVKRGLNARWRAKIHIRHPHRKATVGGHAKHRLHRVPFDGMGAKAVDRSVEGHRRGPCAVLCSDYSNGVGTSSRLVQGFQHIFPIHSVFSELPSDAPKPLRQTRPNRKSSAMIRSILIHPDPRLKKLCDPVAQVTGDLVKLAHDMLDTMYDAPGIGLAAPQVSVTKRLIVMDCMKAPEPPRPLILFNPAVVWSSSEVATYEEGCLSIPEQYADVERPNAVTVRWMDETGAAREETFAGLWATCVQHEIDHLNGKLFIDYLGLMKRQMITRKMEKLKREMARGETKGER